MNNASKMEDAKTNIINILKMEGYKLNSGELFVAFKESGGEMENFKGALEELTEENKIQSDSDGNIMTVEDYQRQKSQKSEPELEHGSKEENVEDKEEESVEEENEDELESIIKLKEETDSWLIEKLKNNGNSEELQNEIDELKKRVSKLEKVISNLTRAFD